MKSKTYEEFVEKFKPKKNNRRLLYAACCL
nr:MAG TPA: hypothetical protein [Caudoviricetes sp.]